MRGTDRSTNAGTGQGPLPAHPPALDDAMWTSTSALAAGASPASQVCDLHGSDGTETALRVTAAMVSYQAALQTTAGIRQRSLLDFLR
jgi:hypothetical protein